MLVEHKDGKVAGATLNAIAAAGRLNGDITALVASSPQHADQVTKAAAALKGVKKVIY